MGISWGYLIRRSTIDPCQNLVNGMSMIQLQLRLVFGSHKVGIAFPLLQLKSDFQFVNLWLDLEFKVKLNGNADVEGGIEKGGDGVSGNVNNDLSGKNDTLSLSFPKSRTK
ncbi:OLC1v1004445C1 [Oldenlandia corymbosa var. corymbosa]|uniref:OLC1v1004445C1 n=1 Tax=Oldenlandia corymbosa var. corymbosa TaxID=529605 RepID=A0AAV1DCB8_OLDCO|nr:OLC1v1004445C1 [Oldenlandia corymbosa var. corymbosa]